MWCFVHGEGFVVEGVSSCGVSGSLLPHTLLRELTALPQTLAGFNWPHFATAKGRGIRKGKE